MCLLTVGLWPKSFGSFTWDTKTDTCHAGQRRMFQKQSQIRKSVRTKVQICCSTKNLGVAWPDMSLCLAPILRSNRSSKVRRVWQPGAGSTRNKSHWICTHLEPFLFVDKVAKHPSCVAGLEMAFSSSGLFVNHESEKNSSALRLLRLCGQNELVDMTVHL